MLNQCEYKISKAAFVPEPDTFTWWRSHIYSWSQIIITVKASEVSAADHNDPESVSGTHAGIWSVWDWVQSSSNCSPASWTFGVSGPQTLTAIMPPKAFSAWQLTLITALSAVFNYAQLWFWRNNWEVDWYSEWKWFGAGKEGNQIRSDLKFSFSAAIGLQMQVLLRQPDHTNKHMNGAANNSKCKQPASLEKAIYVHHNYLFSQLQKTKSCVI